MITILDLTRQSTDCPDGMGLENFLRQPALIRPLTQGSCLVCGGPAQNIILLTR